MKQTESVISTYTADVSGVCSALYEMGGMVVMHDASGCNSTYNTHDEPRWYDMPSMVYISGLSEMEAVLGDEGKLVRDICEAAKELNPRFIAVAGTPIPMMMGTDFPGVARMIERRTGIPAFGFATNGMHSYVSGAGMALSAIAERFCPPELSRDSGPRPSVNLLGVTPLDFSVTGNVEAMRKYFTENGFPVVSCWAMGSPWEELMRAGTAAVNVVVSSCGLPLAETLRRKYGTPYVTGAPFGESFSKQLLAAVEQAAQDGQNRNLLKDAPSAGKDAGAVIIGEAVCAGSLRRALELDFGASGVRILSPLDTGAELLRESDSFSAEEDDLFAALKEARIVIADPLYRMAVRGNDTVQFIDLPHEGCSGRIYRKDIPILIGACANDWLEKRFCI